MDKEKRAKPKTERARISAYLPSRVSTKLDEMAHTSQRSKSALIADALEVYYKDRDKWN